MQLLKLTELKAGTTIKKGQVVLMLTKEKGSLKPNVEGFELLNKVALQVDITSDDSTLLYTRLRELCVENKKLIGASIDKEKAFLDVQEECKILHYNVRMCKNNLALTKNVLQTMQLKLDATIVSRNIYKKRFNIYSQSIWYKLYKFFGGK